jgi:hypothetical protein
VPWRLWLVLVGGWRSLRGLREESAQRRGQAIGGGVERGDPDRFAQGAARGAGFQPQTEENIPAGDLRTSHTAGPGRQSLRLVGELIAGVAGQA